MTGREFGPATLDEATPRPAAVTLFEVADAGIVFQI